MGTFLRDKEDWRFNRREFRALQEEFGTFTLEACADVGGTNAHCPRLCSKERSFLQQDVRGERVWCNPPFFRAWAFIRHYLQNERRDSSTAGMFVLPVWKDRPWWQDVQHMEQVRLFPKGTHLLIAACKEGGRRDMGPTPWDVVVLRDAPTHTPQAPQQELNSMPLALSSSLLRFVGVVGGHKCTVLIDSGSRGNFVSHDFVSRHRVPTAATADLLEVQLPSAQTLRSGRECVQLPLPINTYMDKVDLRVLDMKGYDVILGKPWLTRMEPTISYRTNTVSVLVSGEQHTFSTPDHLLNPNPTGKVVLLHSIKQVHGAVRQGGELFLARLKQPTEGGEAQAGYAELVQQFADVCADPTGVPWDGPSH
jgi:hypothetical protein